MALRKFINKKTRHNLGLPPGTVVVDDDKSNQIFQKISVTKIAYNQSSAEKETLVGVDQLTQALKNERKDLITWININSTDPNIVKIVGDIINLHPLVQEDIVNTHQRPKLEDWDDYLYVVIKMLYHDKEKDQKSQEQVSLILGQKYLISFQEKPGDVFEIVRNRIINNKGRIRQMKTAYLFYSLFDAIIDQYFIVLDLLGEEACILEKKLEEESNNQNLTSIQKLKQEVIMIRRFIIPAKELVASCIKSESELMDNEINPFLRDLQDHIHHVTEAIEMLRDLINGIIEIAHSSLSNKMNEIMKVLTIVSTIFIPITFIAGIYGMNFEHMPELQLPWAYPITIASMILIAIAMLSYFKSKKWW